MAARGLSRATKQAILGAVNDDLASVPGQRSSSAAGFAAAGFAAAGVSAAGVSVAGLFPGQGSHTAGMRELVEAVLPELASSCIELVGTDPFVHAAQSTRFAQPAIFCASIAAWTAHTAAAGASAASAGSASEASEASEASAGSAASAGSQAPPLAYAGHSLGELAALVAAGALDLADGLRLSVLRGELMAAAAERDGDGGMLALIGASQAQCDALLVGHAGIVLANDNAPGQVVLAGAGGRLRELAADARGQGLRALVLDVAGAFHSPAMAPAVEPFAAALADVEFDFPRARVVSCASAAPFVDIRGELAQAIVKPVRWRETMSTLAGLGADAFLDYGPGRVLARLVPRNLPGARSLEPALPETATGSTERAA